MFREYECRARTRSTQSPFQMTGTGEWGIEASSRFGIGWAVIIAAELVAARSGLGFLIADGMEILRSDRVLVGMVVIALLGVAFDTVFRVLNWRFGWSG